jgi:hypothetical protein
MRHLVMRTATIAVVGALVTVPLVPATAQVARPQAVQASAAADDAITPVRWRGRGGAAIGAGIVAGALLGAGVAASRPYYGPGPYYYGPGYYAPPPPVVYAPAPVYGDPIAYCMQRFRSYDPASGTYLGYDGYRHPCP